jgi:hypothetical protein
MTNLIIYSAWKQDKINISQYHMRENLNIHHRYRSDSMESNYARQQARECK